MINMNFKSKINEINIIRLFVQNVHVLPFKPISTWEEISVYPMNRSVIRNILLFLSISRFFNSLRYTYFGKYFNEFQDLKIYKKKNFTAKPIKKLSYI